MNNGATLDGSDCMLGEGPFYQCCCNCKHHWQDFHHCTIPSEVQAKKEGCCCSVPKGWICVGMRMVEGGEHVHSGWPEHSVGCEMYTPIRNIPRPESQSAAIIDRDDS